MTQKIRPRHPEKVKNPINPIKKKPEWIRSKLSNSKEFFLNWVNWIFNFFRVSRFNYLCHYF